jgi:hypothetical protein
MNTYRSDTIAFFAQIMWYLFRKNRKYFCLVPSRKDEITEEVPTKQDPTSLFTIYDRLHYYSGENVMEVLVDKNKMQAILKGEPVAGTLFTGKTLVSTKITLEKLAHKLVTYSQSVCYQWRHMYLCIFPIFQEEKTITVELSQSPLIVSPPTLWEPDHDVSTESVYVASYSFTSALVANWNENKGHNNKLSDDVIKQNAYKSVCAHSNLDYRIRIRSQLAFFVCEQSSAPVYLTDNLQVHWNPVNERQTRETIDLRRLKL